MKKLLYIENVASINAMNFYKTAAIAAQKCGLEFHLAYNAKDRTEEIIEELLVSYGVHFHQIDFIRAPYDPRNFKAYKQICELINDKSIDYIHCNTPIGGVVGRLAGVKCNVKKIIYQAHGFHFYKGAPQLNWLIYYPIEKLLAKKTDAIITINKEDFERAKEFKLRNNGPVYYVPGVGIDLSQYESINTTRMLKREELGLRNDDIALISVGELNKNKNNHIVIEAMAKLNSRNLHYYLCGIGPCENELRNMAKKNGIKEQVHFLGYRTDIKELLQAADIFVMPSFREGLSRSIMEAMASGLPCVVSKIRGNTDLIADGEEGYLCDPLDVEAFNHRINILYKERDTRIGMSKAALGKIEEFNNDTLINDYKDIYEKIILS